MDLVALERVVVDEGDGVQADVDRLGDGRDRRRLRAPADLGIDEIVGHAELAQPAHRLIVIVLAGDREQDAAGVESPQGRQHRRVEPHLVAFEQDSVPERAVEVPDHHLDGLYGLCRRRFGVHGDVLT